MIRTKTDPIAKPGLYSGETWVHPKDYHASDRLSRSNVVDILRGPEYFIWSKNHSVQPTPAMVLGDMVHTAVLEPDRFSQEYVVAPDVNRRTKAGKEELAAFEAEHAGMTIVRSDDNALALQIAARVAREDSLRAVLRGPGMTEPTAAWDTDDGLRLRARADRVFFAKDGEPTIVDLKTAVDGSERAFKREIAVRKLHLQAAYYLDGFSAVSEHKYRSWMYVVVEKSPPFKVRVYALDEDSIRQGRIEYHAALSVYRRCNESGDWTEPTTIHPIGLPGWAIE